MLITRKKDVVILGTGPKQGLDDTALTSDKEYSINFTGQHKIFCLSLHYNGVNSYLFVNGAEIFKFKAKASEVNSYPVCLGNISKDFLINNMEKIGLYGCIQVI